MIASIRLQNFRSYKDETFEVGGKVNIIVGPNASGKTNILEAIQLACLGSSHRRRDGQLVRFGKQWSRIDLQVGTVARIVKIENDDHKDTKSFVINSQPLKRLPLTKQLPLVIFEPSHLQLFSGNPEARRDFLDDLISQTVPGYSPTRRSYKRTLAQRNSLLKNSPANIKSQIFAWDVRLSQLAGQIVSQRLKLVDVLNKDIAKIYRKLSNSRVKTEVVYTSSLNVNNYETNLLRKLQNNLDTDLLRGFTAHGPHRDDIEVLLGGHLAQDTASRGEVRTLLLALKMLEVRIIESSRGTKPVLLLDDVFSELDGSRRQALTSFLQSYQTFITTTDADVVIQHFIGKCHIIPVTKN